MQFFRISLDRSHLHKIFLHQAFKLIGQLILTRNGLIDLPYVQTVNFPNP